MTTKMIAGASDFLWKSWVCDVSDDSGAALALLGVGDITVDG